MSGRWSSRPVAGGLPPQADACAPEGFAPARTYDRSVAELAQAIRECFRDVQAVTTGDCLVEPPPPILLLLVPTAATNGRFRDLGKQRLHVSREAVVVGVVPGRQQHVEVCRRRHVRSLTRRATS